MQKIKLEEKLERKKRFTAVGFFSIALTLFLAFLQLILSNQLAGYSQQLSALRQEEKAVLLQNELLQKQIASESSIMAISRRAQEQAFVAPTRFLVVAEQESVALLHNGL
ncbi:hypothetical protein HYT17_01460 [Candidatus Microgenomates bacterium]|nr:hypothetical protein [Candidatus Microgenomates bacterium]